MKTLNTTSQLFTKETANRIAAEMNESDSDWDYRPVHDPKKTGYSFIEIYDEDGEFIAKL